MPRVHENPRPVEQKYLYCDVDDTLILWHDRYNKRGLYVRLEGDYELNKALITDINCFLGGHPDYKLRVWSGGGVQYAAKFAEECFPGMDLEVISKEMQWPREGDVCIDDWEIVPSRKGVHLVKDLATCPLCAPARRSTSTPSNKPESTC